MICIINKKMRNLVITGIIALAMGRRSGGSSAQESSYIEYDTDWYYDPGPSNYVPPSYYADTGSAQASTYIEYETGWHYNPGPSHYSRPSYYDPSPPHYTKTEYYDSGR